MAETKVNINKKNSSSLIGVIKNQLHTNIKQYTMFIALIGIGLIFTVLTDGIFLTSRNLSNLLLQTATIAILATGMVLVIVGGHIDLSVGSVAGFTGAIAAILQVKMGWGTLPTILVAIVVGIIVGVWQGYWIAYREVPAFIVTLAGMLIFRGAVIGVTNGATIAPMSDSFKAIGQAYIPRLFSENAPIHDTTLIIGIIFIVTYVLFELKKRTSRMNYGFDILPMNIQIAKMIAVSLLIGAFFMIMVLYMGMPYSIILVMALVFLYSYISNRTTFGRHVYAIGGNKEASKLSGINIKQKTMMIFVSMGFLCSIAGIVFTARLNSATASAGNLFELDAIASCFIGGASSMGGEGTVMGAIIGALVMATINNGMSLMNVPSTYQYIVKGLILLLAVWIDIASRKKNA